MEKKMNERLQKSLSETLKYNTIIFGPMIGELGWTIIRWAPFTRWSKQNHPEKKVIACDYIDRYDLYYGLVDDFFSTEIKHLHKYMQNCYHLDNLPEQIYQKEINRIREHYPKAYIFEPRQFSCGDKYIIPWYMMNHNFTPRIKNKQVINKIVQNNNKKILNIAPRHRIDLSLRNWGRDKWLKLFELLHKVNKYFIFISGKSPSIIRPPKEYDNFICLEDYVEEGTSLIGLSIESLLISDLCISSQSAIPLLSLLLRTPVLMWGNQKERHQRIENIHNTKCIFIEDIEYKIEADEIFNIIIKRNAKK